MKKFSEKPDQYTRRLFELRGMENPDTGFSERLMQQIEALPRPIVYKPLINPGFLITAGALLVFFLVWLGFSISPGAAIYNPENSTGFPSLKNLTLLSGEFNSRFLEQFSLLLNSLPASAMLSVIFLLLLFIFGLSRSDFSWRN